MSGTRDFPEEVLLRLAVLPYWDGCDLLEELGEVPGEDHLRPVLDAYEAELGIDGDLSVAEVYGVDLTRAVGLMMSVGRDPHAYHEVYAAARDLPDVDADRLVRYLRAVTEAFLRAVEERAEEAGLNPRRFGLGFGAAAEVGALSDVEFSERVIDSIQDPLQQQIMDVAIAAGEHGGFDGLSQREIVGFLRAKTLRLITESRCAGVAVTGDELRVQVDGALLLVEAAIETAPRFGDADDPPATSTTPLGVPRSADAAAVLAAASAPYLNRLGLPEGHSAHTEAAAASLANAIDAEGGSDLSEPLDRAAIGATMASPASDQAFDRHHSLAAARSASGSPGARLAPGAIHSIIDAARFHADVSNADVIRVPQYLLAGGVFDSAFAANTWAQRLAAKTIAFHALTAAPFYVPAALMPAVADAEPLDPSDLADLRLPYRANLVYFEQPIDVTAISRTPAAQPFLSNDSNGVHLILPPDRINGLILLSEEDGTIVPLFMWIGSFSGAVDSNLTHRTIESFLTAARWGWVDNGNGPDPYRPFVGELIEHEAAVDFAYNAGPASHSGFVFQPAWLPDCDYPDIVHAAAALISWGDWRQPDPYTLPPEGTREHRKALRSSAARKAITRGQTAAVNIAYLRPRNDTPPAPREPLDGARKKASPKAHLRRTHWRRSRVATRDAAGDIVGDVHGAQGTDWHYVRHLIPAGVVNPTGAPADPDRVYKLVPRR